MDIGKRILSAVGASRVIRSLGGLYVVFALGWGVVHIERGIPLVNAFIIILLIIIPGILLLYGGYWITRTNIDPEFYPDIASWCLAGFAAMVGILALYHLQPEGGISSPWTSPPILTALSSVAGFAVGVQDGRAKTRTRQLEDAIGRLEASNDRLSRYREYTNDILDSIHDVFYVLDEDGTLQRWNESLREVTGYSETEIASMRAVEFFDEDEHELIADAIAEGFETGSVQVEAELLTRDGQHVPYEFAASMLETPEGERILAGIGRDITERKQREGELRRRARQQQVVADLGQFALETDDLDELMHEATRQVADVLDAEYCEVLELDETNDELLLRQGVGWEDGVVGEATVSAIESNTQAAYTLANDHPIVVEDLETETRFSSPELLTSHDVRSGISTVIGPFEDSWGILGTHDTDRRTYSEEDVSFVQSVANVLAEAIERHRYQAELEQLVADLEASNERLEQFAYAASHDLQEPLRMVSSYLQLIESRADDELTEETQEFLEYAVDGADRMRAMIDGLLEYSRVETQGEPLEPVDLDEVIADVQNDLEARIAECDAEIHIEELPHVLGDEHQLRQVFQNLLKNALEYSGNEPPQVHVFAEPHGSEWKVSVRDEGVGIDPAEQEQIFEIFERSNPRGSRPGSGIGLAICERIVERHGGDIWVESEPGEGATFSFILPTTSEYDGETRSHRTGRYSARRGQSR